METETLENKRRYGTIEDFNRNNFNKRYVFVLNHQNSKPSIEGRYFPSSYSLKLEDLIFDENKLTNRVIRVVDGEISIFKDEQTEDGQRKEAIRKSFGQNGDLVVEGREKLVLEFFLKSNFNGSNPYRDKNKRPIFFMLDLKQGLAEQMGKDKADAEALNWCYTAKFKDLMRYARVLGIPVEDKDPDEVRWGLVLLAKKDPKKFNEGLNNKYTTRKFYVFEAMDKGFVTIDRMTNTIKWGNTGNIITASPVGKDPVDHFVDLSFSAKDMDMAFTVLKEMVEPTEQKTEQIKQTEKLTETSDAVIPVVKDIELLTTRQLIELALKKGVIIQKTSWFYFLDKSFQGKKLNEAIESNAMLKASIEKAVSESP